jgi:hypothetical protein
MKKLKTITFILVVLCVYGIRNSSAAPINPNGEKHIAACRAVVDAVNQRKLVDLVIPFTDFTQVDINNDGKLERVVLTSDGTMRVESLEVFDENGKPITLVHSNEDDWEGDNLSWAMDQMLIKYGGEVYILGKTNDYLNYLSRVDKNNVEKVICEFGQRPAPVETLVTSSKDKLCQGALKQELNYVTFDRLHAITHAAVQEAGFDQTNPGKYAAQMDINNDGTDDLVVELDLASGAGRGCDARHLGVLNKARNKLDMDVTRQLPEPMCEGVGQTPFVFEGQTYIEVKYASRHPTNIHKVIQLKESKLETVCEYDVRVVNYVLGEYERILKYAEADFIDPWVYALDMPGNGGLQTLMDAKHDIKIKVRSNAFGTVLHEAINRKRYDALQFLLANGADPNATTKDSPPGDMPPLIFAIWLNSTEGMGILLKYGANRNQTWSGQSPKDWVSIWARSDKDKALMMKLLSKK